MVEIQPYEFKKKTNIEEHNDIVSKVNEIVDVINDTQMDTINTRLTAVEGDVTALESEVSTINNELDTKADKREIPDTSTLATKTEVEAVDTKVDTKVDAIDSQLDTMQTEVDGLLKEVVDGVVMSSTAHGTVQVQINHEDGSNDISAPIDLGLVEQGGIVLQSGTTDRSFKLIVTLTDGTSWQTNDFVIPEGGGTDVSVTNISIAQGTGANKIQVKIGLSDGSTISSNDWTVVTPSEFAALGTRVTTAEGNITKNTGDISDLDSRVQALEDAPGYALQPATTTRLGGVKIGAGITVQSDGTIAVDMKFTADETKVTLHADSLAGSEFTKDIPQASQGGAGTIDQASYAKIAATESKVNALAPTVTVNEEVDPPTITVGINGKTAQANLPSSQSASGISLISPFIHSDIYNSMNRILRLETIANPEFFQVDNPSIDSNGLLDVTVLKDFAMGFSFAGSSIGVLVKKGTKLRAGSIAASKGIRSTSIMIPMTTYVVDNGGTSISDMWTNATAITLSIIFKKIAQEYTVSLAKLVSVYILSSSGESNPSTTTKFLTNSIQNKYMFENNNNSSSVLLISY